MPKAARGAAAAIVITAVLVIAFRTMGDRGGDGPDGRQLDDVAENLPEPEPDARLLSKETEASEAVFTYRLPLGTDPALAAQYMATKLESLGWAADEPRLIDHPGGITEALFIATRAGYTATVSASSEPADFTVTITLTPAEATPQAVP